MSYDNRNSFIIFFLLVYMSFISLLHFVGENYHQFILLSSFFFNKLVVVLASKMKQAKEIKGCIFKRKKKLPIIIHIYRFTYCNYVFLYILLRIIVPMFKRNIRLSFLFTLLLWL